MVTQSSKKICWSYDRAGSSPATPTSKFVGSLQIKTYNSSVRCCIRGYEWRMATAAKRGAMAQLEAHLLCTQRVRGSNPLSSRVHMRLPSRGVLVSTKSLIFRKDMYYVVELLINPKINIAPIYKNFILCFLLLYDGAQGKRDPARFGSATCVSSSDIAPTNRKKEL